MKDIDLSGRVALVTGAGAGLGRAYAAALARYGATVMVNDLFPEGRRDAPSETPTVDSIRADGGKAHWLPGDVSDRAQAKAMVDKVVADQGRLDILVTNAGVSRYGPFEAFDLDDFELTIRVHLFGAVNMAHAAWPVMRRQQYGRVIFITSSITFGNAGASAYSAAKAAQLGLVRTLGLEGEAWGIKVNAVAPVARAQDLEALFTEAYKQKMSPRFPAEAVVFLASDDAPQRRVIYAAGGGYSTVRQVDSGGVFLGEDADANRLRERFAEVEAMSAPTEHASCLDHMVRFNHDLGLPQDIVDADARARA